MFLLFGLPGIVGFVLGMLIGTFCPVPVVIATGIIGVFILLACFFLFANAGSDSGLGPMILFIPGLFAVGLLVGTGMSYYLATGQTGIQDIFRYLRSTTVH